MELSTTKHLTSNFMSTKMLQFKFKTRCGSKPVNHTFAAVLNNVSQLHTHERYSSASQQDINYSLIKGTEIREENQHSMHTPVSQL